MVTTATLFVVYLPNPVTDHIESTLAPVRIAAARQPGSALMIIAHELGFLAEAGLDVTFVTHPSGKRALIDGLGAGADLATSTDLPVARQLAEGDDLVVLAAMQTTRSVHAIVARRDRDIDSIADLAGKIVGTQSLSALHFFAEQALAVHDIGSNEVTMRFLPVEDIVAALIAGELDAASLREPYLSETTAAMGAGVVVFEAPWVYTQHELLVAGRDYAETHREVIERVIRALVSAERFTIEHPAESEMALAEGLGSSRAEAGTILANTANRIGFSQSILALMEEELRWIDGFIETDSRVPDNLLEVLDLNALESVRPERIFLAGRGFVEVGR